MSDNISKLVQMLADKKISQEEFNELKAVLDKKPQNKTAMLMAFNPYEFINGWSALIVGVLSLLFMSLLSSKISTHFPGVLDYKLLEEPLSFSRILIQNFVAVGLLAALFFASAKILKQKNLRALDFFSSATLSRYPYMVVTLFLAALFYAGVDLRIEGMNTMKDFTILAAVLLGLVWQGVAYYNAFKFSSGLTSTKLNASFFVSIIFAEILSIILLNVI